MHLVQYSNFDYILTNDPDTTVAMFGIRFERLKELDNLFKNALNEYLDKDPEGEKSVKGIANAFAAVTNGEAEERFAMFRAGCVDGVFSARYVGIEEGGDNE